MLAAIAVTACQRDLKFEDQQFNLSLPVASTSLSLKDFVADENYLVDGEGKVSLRYDLNIYNANPIDQLVIPNKEDFHKASLETIKLSNTALSTKVTLAQAYPASVILNGQRVSVPALELDNASKVDIDANTFFESALLESGKMFLKVENGFPVEIEYMNFILTNKSDDAQIAEMEFFNIKPGETQIDSADMTGVYAEGNMVGELIKVKTKASETDVLINSKDAIKFEVSVKDLQAFEAVAIFPAQNLIDHDLSWDYDFGGPELTELTIASGSMVVEVESNVDETIYVRIELPSLTNNGDTVIQDFVVPPASNGNPFSKSETVSLAGYDVNLRGKRGQGWTEVNSFHNRLVARIDSSGVLKNISKNDSITLRVGLIDIIPSYAKGYLGKDSITYGPAKTNFDVFRKLNGILDIKDLNLSLNVSNSAGVNGQVMFDGITSINKQGNEVDLKSDLISKPIEIGRASDRNTPFTNSINFTPNNSNVDEFIENLPVSIAYGLGLQINPDGNISSHQDFFYDDSEIKASVLLDIPMNVEPEHISMIDTFNVDFSSFSNIENLDYVNLNLIIYNGYPYASDVDFLLLDENDNLVDTLFGANTIASPGLLPDFGDKIETASKTLFTNSLSKEQIDKLSLVKSAVVIASFKSTSIRPYIIYDSYTIDVKLTADIEYTQSFE